MKFDEIIKAKKDELDVENPPIELWESIRKEWKKDSKPRFQLWKVAAALFLASTFALLFYTQSLHNKMDKLTSLGDISKEYNEIEKDYKSQIKVLEASLPLGEINKSNDYSWLLDELKTLDEINKIYQDDLGKGIAKEQLVGVLIDYYEKRIQLLKKLDLEVKRSEKAKREESEKAANKDVIRI